MHSVQLAIVREPVSNPLASTCPKCETACSFGRACPRCGLAANRRASFVRREQPVDAALTAAWQAVVANWEVPACHDELLRLTTRHEAWAWAATRYRECARKGDLVAASQLRRLEKGIVVSAFTRMQTREDKAPKPYRTATTTLVLLIVLLVGGFFYGTKVRKAPMKPATASATELVGGVR